MELLLSVTFEVHCKTPPKTHIGAIWEFPNTSRMVTQFLQKGERRVLHEGMISTHVTEPDRNVTQAITANMFKIGLPRVFWPEIVSKGAASACEIPLVNNLQAISPGM